MKPLPCEVLQNKSFAKEYNRENILALLKKRLKLKEISRDEKIIDKACYRMIRYVQYGKNFSLDEIKDLLDSLELSTITIQKRKKHLVEKAGQRNK